MKKTNLLLALLMILSMAMYSCSKDDEPTNSENSDKDDDRLDDYIPNDTALMYFSIANNDTLYKDIVFVKKSDKEYTADVAYGVDLSDIVASFNYDGTIKYGDQTLGKTVQMDFSSGSYTFNFDGSDIKFTVNRVSEIPIVTITTDGQQSVDTKDHYFGCQITVDGKNLCPDYQTKSEAGDSIKGRGNSTWLFYPKKPYKVKLSKKAKFLGMHKGKKFVMLANYRDPTNFMDALMADLARNMDMPFTNTNHFAEVYLNGDYIGLYLITEQIEKSKGSVDIDSTSGVLISLDHDDGPVESPNATNNFYSSVFWSSYDSEGLPICVKYPENPTSSQLDDIKLDFKDVEDAINSTDYSKLKQLMDVNTFFGFLIVQEMSKNVELVTPRSMYLFHDADGVWKWGPVWDFDGGFSYDWVDYAGQGRGYFGSQSFMMGPEAHRDIPAFFTKMFTNNEFLEDYKAYWKTVAVPAISKAVEQMEVYNKQCDAAQQRNKQCWSIAEDYKTEINNLKTWMTTRTTKYTSYLNSWKASETILYADPEGDDNNWYGWGK